MHTLSEATFSAGVQSNESRTSSAHLFPSLRKVDRRATVSAQCEEGERGIRKSRSRESGRIPLSSPCFAHPTATLCSRQSMVIPEEREGRDEYNPLLTRDPTPANQQGYGLGAAATIDHSDTRRGGLTSMTTIAATRPKVDTTSPSVNR